MTALSIPLRTERTESTTAPVLLSIVIALRNRGAQIAHELQRVARQLMQEPFRSEIIVVDDGSSDETVDRCIASWQEFEGNTEDVEIRILGNDKTCGLGYSSKQGMLIARGQWVLILDTGALGDIDQIDRLLTAVHNGADVAIGCRSPRPDDAGNRHGLSAELNESLAWIAHELALPRLTEARSAPKLYHRSAARDIAGLQSTSGRTFGIEHLILADRLGYQVAYVDLHASVEEGKQRSPLGSTLKTVWELMRMRWAHRKLRQSQKGTEPDRFIRHVRIGRLIYQSCLPWWPAISQR